jgi:hypothetical protein
MNVQASKPHKISPVSRLIATLGVAATVGVWNPPLSLAQEHPAEHPQTPPKPESKSNVTLEDVATYIEGYVKDKSANGLFSVTDKIAGKKLSLKLDKVHRERLSQVGPDMFFVCADFTTADGAHTYDLDFFVQGKSKDTLAVVEEKTSIHKEDGKERYTWAFNAREGVWEQKPAGTKTKEQPAQEHP